MKQEDLPTRMDHFVTIALAMLMGPFIIPSAAYAFFIEIWLYMFQHFFPALHEPLYPTFCALCPGHTFGGSFGMPVIVKC
jgi:hypothetical protein